jgi:hypothetical protein
MVLASQVGDRQVVAKLLVRSLGNWYCLWTIAKPVWIENFSQDTHNSAPRKLRADDPVV